MLPYKSVQVANRNRESPSVKIGSCIFSYGDKFFFCNMADIEKCIKELPVNEPYNIYHFWNGKPERLSRKTLKSFMNANQLNDQWIK